MCHGSLLLHFHWQGREKQGLRGEFTMIGMPQFCVAIDQLTMTHGTSEHISLAVLLMDSGTY